MFKIDTDKNQKLDFPIEISYPHGVVSYYKKTTKTAEVIPTSDKIGAGNVAQVFYHKHFHDLVVKKSFHPSLKKEYKIGRKLQHPNLVHTIALFKKIIVNEDSKEEQIKYKLVLKKINGATIANFIGGNGSLSPETTIKILGQVQSLTEYLFDKEIVAGDSNDGNVFITPEMDIIFLDLGAWIQIKDPRDRAVELIKNTTQVIINLLKAEIYNEAIQQRKFDEACQIISAFDFELRGVIRESYGWESFDYKDLIRDFFQKVTDRYKTARDKASKLLQVV